MQTSNPQSPTNSCRVANKDRQKESARELGSLRQSQLETPLLSKEDQDSEDAGEESQHSGKQDQDTSEQKAERYAAPLRGYLNIHTEVLA